MRIILEKNKEEAVESLKAVSQHLTYIRNRITNLSDEDRFIFRYMQLELISAANAIGGKEAANIVFDSTKN